MILFHGSNIEVSQPKLKLCHHGNDFGKGFYLTNNPLRALLVARRRVQLYGGKITISSFYFSLKDAIQNETKILHFPKFTTEWARFVLNNRCPNATSHGYDIVIGPVADSAIDNEIEKYKLEFGDNYLDDNCLIILVGRISQFGYKYIQYCFCTEISLTQLKFKSNER